MAARIVIADHQKKFRDFLKRTLQTTGSFFEVVGEAADGANAVQLVETLKPDLVVMDLELPQTGGLQATRIIKSRAPQVKILLL